MALLNFVEMLIDFQSSWNNITILHLEKQVNQGRSTRCQDQTPQLGNSQPTGNPVILRAAAFRAAKNKNEQQQNLGGTGIIHL